MPIRCQNRLVFLTSLQKYWHSLLVQNTDTPRPFQVWIFKVTKHDVHSVFLIVGIDQWFHWVSNKGIFAFISPFMIPRSKFINNYKSFVGKIVYAFTSCRRFCNMFESFYLSSGILLTCFIMVANVSEPSYIYHFISFPRSLDTWNTNPILVKLWSSSIIDKKYQIWYFLYKKWWKFALQESTQN